MVESPSTPGARPAVPGGHRGPHRHAGGQQGGFVARRRGKKWSEAGVKTKKKLEVMLNISDWIGLRENLQETIDFPIKYGAFL